MIRFDPEQIVGVSLYPLVHGLSTRGLRFPKQDGSGPQKIALHGNHSLSCRGGDGGSILVSIKTQFLVFFNGLQNRR